MLRKYNMAILIICVVLGYFVDGHYRKMRVLRPGGLANLRLMRSRSILALALSQAIILDLSNSLSIKLVTSARILHGTLSSYTGLTRGGLGSTHPQMQNKTHPIPHMH